MLRSGWFRLIALSLGVLPLTIPLSAQEEKGAGRPRGGSTRGGTFSSGENKLALLRLEPVQAELKITPEQKTKLTEVQASLRDPSAPRNQRNLSQEERATRRENRVKAVAEAEKKLGEILKPEQTKRLGEIQLQQRGPLALKDEAVAKELKLSQEQLGKIDAAIQWRQEEQQKLVTSPADRSSRRDPKLIAERREKQEKLQKEFEGKVLAALTDAQKDQFEKLKGSPFKLERGAAGRGGTDAGPGGGGQGSRRSREGTDGSSGTGGKQSI